MEDQVFNKNIDTVIDFSIVSLKELKERIKEYNADHITNGWNEDRYAKMRAYLDMTIRELGTYLMRIEDNTNSFFDYHHTNPITIEDLLKDE